MIDRWHFVSYCGAKFPCKKNATLQYLGHPQPSNGGHVVGKHAGPFKHGFRRHDPVATRFLQAPAVRKKQGNVIERSTLKKTAYSSCSKTKCYYRLLTQRTQPRVTAIAKNDVGRKTREDRYEHPCSCTSSLAHCDRAKRNKNNAKGK